MKYPKFLTNDSTIGITAPSAGIGKYSKEFDLSLENLKINGWKIIETPNVRTEGDVSSSAKERAEQFQDLYLDDYGKVDAIICATGGDFLTDMLPYIEDEYMRTDCKWVMGASDPTNLLYYMTTCYDIATMYGHNAGSFDAKKLYQSQQIAIEFLKGNIIPQESYNLYEKEREGRINGEYNLTEKVEWKSNKQEFEIEGRIIGGCLDCLRYLPGTKSDCTRWFTKKYKKDGFIWYFDIFSMSAEDVYLTLFQLKETGWFEYIKGVIVGRVLFPKNYTSMTYNKAFEKIFGNIPIIMDADIGHVAPKMTIINGSIAKITWKNNKGKIEQILR